MEINENFWSGIDIETISPAKILLQKQAANLGQITKNVVEAYISTTISVDNKVNGFIDPPKYSHCFNIVAPLIGYQEVILFCINQIIGVEYPLDIFSTYWKGKENCVCNNIEELRKCIKEILSSDETRKIVNSIIAESK